MTEKEFIRALCAECKRNGIRISQPNMKKIIKSLRNVVFKSCLEEKEVRLRGFCTFTPEMTRKVILPNGENNKQRLTIRVKLTEVFRRRFKKMAVMLRNKEIELDDIYYDIFFEDDEVYDDEIGEDEEK